MNPCFFLLEHFICVSHYKIHWTISVDNVGLRMCLLWTSNSKVTLTDFPWWKSKWTRVEFNRQSQVLQAWDDFMVHGVTSLLGFSNLDFSK